MRQFGPYPHAYPYNLGNGGAEWRAMEEPLDLNSQKMMSAIGARSDTLRKRWHVRE